MSSMTDKLNSFILEFKEELSLYDMVQFENALSFVKEGVVDKLINSTINPKLYVDYINKTVEDLNSISVDVSEIDNFFSVVYKSVSLGDKNIALPLQPKDEVEKLRPEYLESMASEFESAIKGILAGKVSEGEIKKKYASGEYFFKVRKQVAKTTITMNDVRDLIMADNPTIVKVDNTFVQSNVIPFLREYPQTVKDLNVLALNTKAKINSTFNTISSIVNSLAVTKTKLDPKTNRLLDYCTYNFLRQYMSTCAYVSSLLIRKISFYSFNMMAYVNLQNTLYHYYPEGELVLHENVIDGTLTEIDDTTLLNSMLHNELRIVLPHIQLAIGKKKMEIANYVAKHYNVKIDYMEVINTVKYPYDTYPYASANKTLIEIANNLHTLETALSNTDLVVDDIIQNAGLEETFITKYSSVLANIPDLKYYDSQRSMLDNDEDVLMSIYSDIGKFEKNIKIVSDNVYKCYTYIEKLIDSFSDNKYNLDQNSYNELKSFLDTIMKTFKDYTLQLTKKLLERLDLLTDNLEDIEVDEDISEPEKFVPYDYSFDAVEEAFNEIERAEQAYYEYKLREYNASRNKLDRGVKLVYEDTTEAPAGSTTPSVNNDGAPSTSTSDANANKTNTTNTSNTNNNANNNDDKKKSVIETFKAWVQKILNKFFDMVKRLTGKNNPWLSKVKASIQNLDFSNINVTVAPYEGVNQDALTTQINQSTAKISTINVNNIPADLKGNKKNAEVFLFNGIPSVVGNETSFSAKIKRFFTFGKQNNENLTTYSGEDAKNKVNEMISFCENYDKMSNTIRNSLNKLCDAATKKQQEILTATNVNESTLFTEAPANGTVTVDGKVQKDDASRQKAYTGSVITGCTREYMGAVLTVIEKKYTDYMKVLAKLAPKEEANKAETNNANNEEQNNA